MKGQGDGAFFLPDRLLLTVDEYRLQCARRRQGDDMLASAAAPHGEVERYVGGSDTRRHVQSTVIDCFRLAGDSSWAVDDDVDADVH